ncbi:MAG: hypothetical protein ABSH51_21340 [Solirubrobacteraceae bacterium]|jgi:hypothetical protein
MATLAVSAPEAKRNAGAPILYVMTAASLLMLTAVVLLAAELETWLMIAAVIVLMRASGALVMWLLDVMSGPASTPESAITRGSQLRRDAGAVAR